MNIKDLAEIFKTWQKENLGFIRYKVESKSDCSGGKNWSIQIYLRTGKFSHTKPDYDTEKKIIGFINAKMEVKNEQN